MLPNDPTIQGHATHGYAFNDAMSMDAISTNPICKPHSMHAINTVQIGINPNCPKLSQNGGGKKWPKLSRLGELLNTQKNVHFFAPRGTPRGAKSAPPGGTPLSNINIYIYRPKMAIFGPQNGGVRGARGRPGGARGAPDFPPGKFSGSLACPGGSRGAPMKGVKNDPHSMDAIDALNDCNDAMHAMHVISIDSINDAMHAMHVISIDPIHDALHFVIAQCIGHVPTIASTIAT